MNGAKHFHYYVVLAFVVLAMPLFAHAAVSNPDGTAFALPTDSEFVSNTPVTANAGWVADLGATSNSQFFYDSSTLTIVPVSIPTSQVGLVFAPAP